MPGRPLGHCCRCHRRRRGPRRTRPWLSSTLCQLTLVVRHWTLHRDTETSHLDVQHRTPHRDTGTPRQVPHPGMCHWVPQPLPSDITSGHLRTDSTPCHPSMDCPLKEIREKKHKKQSKEEKRACKKGNAPDTNKQLTEGPTVPILAVEPLPSPALLPAPEKMPSSGSKQGPPWELPDCQLQSLKDLHKEEKAWQKRKQEADEARAAKRAHRTSEEAEAVWRQRRVSVSVQTEELEVVSTVSTATQMDTFPTACAETQTLLVQIPLPPDMQDKVLSISEHGDRGREEFPSEAEDSGEEPADTPMPEEEQTKDEETPDNPTPWALSSATQRRCKSRKKRAELTTLACQQHFPPAPYYAPPPPPPVAVYPEGFAPPHFYSPASRMAPHFWHPYPVPPPTGRHQWPNHRGRGHLPRPHRPHQATSKRDDK